MRLIFSHIPKTAGTSARAYLLENLSALGKIILVDDTHGLKVEDFKTKPLDDNWIFLVGHLDIQTILKQQTISADADDVALISFVRDPLDRLISQFNYARVYSEHPHYEILRNEHLSRYVMGQEGNQQVRWLNAGVDDKVNWKIYIGAMENAHSVCNTVLTEAFGIDESPLEFQSHNVTREVAMESVHKLRNRKELRVEVEEHASDVHQLDIELVNRVRQEGIVRELPVEGLE